LPVRGLIAWFVDVVRTMGRRYSSNLELYPLPMVRFNYASYQNNRTLAVSLFTPQSIRLIIWTAWTIRLWLVRSRMRQESQYETLLVLNSNLGLISNRFLDMTSFLLNFLLPFIQLQFENVALALDG